MSHGAACSQASLLLLLLSLFLQVCHLAHASGTCYLTGRSPDVPPALSLCYMYSHNACCMPSNDVYIREAYRSVVPHGPGCRAGDQRIRASLYNLMRYLCIPCDPREPDYRFETRLGDVEQGGIVPPAPQAPPGEYTWRICRSYLYGFPGKQQGIWGVNARQYDTCGVKLLPCAAVNLFDVDTAEFSYANASCAVALTQPVIPSKEFAHDNDPALQIVLRLPQILPAFQIVIVNDTDPRFDHVRTPCFGRSGSFAVGPVSGRTVILLVLLVSVTLITI